MKTRLALLGSLSALALGGSVVGCTAGSGGGVASASSRNAGVESAAAADKAARASKALTKRDFDLAVTLAEGAVALAPRDAGYRMILAQSYLQAGRFTAARDTFADVVALNPANGKAALNLALSQIATGDWGKARATLAAHGQMIPAVDRGLALALAGDPANGAELLTQVVRSDDNSPKARQNLALALALAGQWGMAKAVAAADLPAAEVDKRIEQWAAFAQPANASDQVAALLGVQPAIDAGQPVALALNGAVTAETRMAVTDTTAVAPPAVAVAQPIKVAVAEQPPVPVFAPVAAERHEVVQPVPAKLIAADRRAVKVAVAAPVRIRAVAFTATPAKGSWFVQIGAYSNAGVAKDGWKRATRKLPALAAHGPSSMSFALKGANFYRLSVGGFSRGEADGLCRRYRAVGGSCFVRSGAGDQIAEWARKGGVQTAAVAGKTRRG